MAHTHEGIWILAEQRHGRVQTVSYELLARAIPLAKKRNTTVSAMLFARAISDDDANQLIARGADRVVVIEDPALAEFLVEPYACCMESVLAEYRPEIVLAAATSMGRTLMPYVAARVHAGLTADCTELDIEPETGNLLQTRPAIGGNILATIKTPDHRPQMATVRPHSMAPAPEVAGRQGEVLRRAAEPAWLRSRMRHVEFVASTDEHALQDAERVVCAGRGVKKAENLKLITALAQSLDAAVAATRDVVDRGWLSYPHQVGLSGKTITPKLYIAAGVSGSIQHLAGMQTAEHIIANTNDPEAQIFRVSELGIIGDLLDVLPAITKAIQDAATNNERLNEREA
jgi:electron transfer flavoprotein alpha subunit